MTLQKDLAMYRITVYGQRGDYEYQLFKNNQFVKSHISDKEYTYCAVNIHPIDGSARIKMANIVSDLSKRDLEDKDTFIVPVTIK